MIPYLTLTIPQTWALPHHSNPKNGEDTTLLPQNSRPVDSTEPPNFQTVNNLIRARARGAVKDDVAVGFVQRGREVPLRQAGASLLGQEGEEEHERPPASNSVHARSLTYAELDNLATKLSARLARTLEGIDGAKRVVALLCPSNLAFLLHLIALWRLGWAVLPIDPNNQALAAANLMRLTSSKHLFYHSSVAGKAKAAEEAAQAQDQVDWTWEFQSEELLEEEVIWALPDANPLEHMKEAAQASPEDPLVIMHTSGSTGLPKPIYQLHRFWTHSLANADGTALAAFTTTPLFHGGMSDFLRSVQAGSAIYFAAPADLGVSEGGGGLSAQSLVRAADLCETDFKLKSHGASSDGLLYFLSVPYILEALASEKVGKDFLGRMCLVSTGGAPLPQHVGDDLVQSSVPLVSRMGSSECGFLMTSFRDYDADKDWSWLRLDSTFEARTWLHFEPASDTSSGSQKLYELIVKPDWPCKIVSNRSDGSYATSDLYMQHPDRPGLWKLTARADDTIVLTNGKKLLASHVESILQKSSFFQHALVFGQNRPLIGALLFPTSSTPRHNTKDFERVESELRKLLLEIQKSMPPHARMARDMLRIMGPEDTDALPKSSKGTVQRVRACRQFQETIDTLYDEFEADSSAGDTAGRLKLNEEELLGWLSERVAECTPNGEAPDPDSDLFQAGIDSTASLRIRASMQRHLALSGSKLSKNVVYEQPTIGSLAQYCYELRTGKQPAAKRAGNENQMLRLVEEYSRRLNPKYSQSANGLNGSVRTRPTIVLTGASGALGSHILRILLDQRRDELESILLLVRAADDATAQEKIAQSLSLKHVATLSEADHKLIQFKAVDTADPEAVELLRLEELPNTIFIHAGWEVNFALGLSSFKACLEGTVNLLRAHLSTSSSRFIFCSTIATCLGPERTGSILETRAWHPSSASSVGYAQAKWVAEQICENAASSANSGHHSVDVIRIGQLCGDRAQGAWNTREAWPLLVKTANEVGMLPDIQQRLDWLPVDTAARALVDLAFGDTSTREGKEDEGQAASILHLVDPYGESAPSWQQLLQWLKQAGLHFDTVSHEKWLHAIRERKPPIQGAALIDIWSKLGSGLSAPPAIETSRMNAASVAFRNTSPLDEKLFAHSMQYWREIEFLQRE